MNIPFTKMSGAGNDFVLLEAARAPRGRRARAALARRLCRRRCGVGADGLLVVGRARGRAPTLEYFNPDGSEAFCGNGARCAARWIYEAGWSRGREAFALRSSTGEVLARMKAGGRVAIRMPAPSDCRLGRTLKVLGRRMRVHSVNTGVPHAVVEVSDLENFAVVETGRALRRHAAFAPQGANANFMRVADGRVNLRTFERGVEDETLACGTGATAAALIACRLGKVRPPVAVRVRGGAVLRISFSTRKDQFGEVWLEGPARTVFTGTIA